MNTLIVRNTARKKGRSILISPQNSSLQALAFGRIILDKTKPMVSVNTRDREIALICLKGEGEIEVGGTRYSVRPYDALYIPPRHSWRMTTLGAVDMAECSAPASQNGFPHLVQFESVKRNPSLHQMLGKESYSREIYRMIDSNVPASRLLCGLVFSKPGNWTSWAPHEHAKQKEEVYLYIHMPRPAFGIQMVYRDIRNIDFIGPVFEDDAVIIKKGYHPNVGIPGYGINFVWMMATLQSNVPRRWEDVNVQEDFRGMY